MFQFEGQGAEVLRTFQTLKITEEDVNKFWTAFNNVNFDGTGKIHMERYDV